MYPVSQKFLTAIKGRSRFVEWHGTILLTDGTELEFSHSQVAQGSGKISLSCSPQDAITWGNAYLGEFTTGLKDLNVDRYALMDAVIDPYVTLHYPDGITTWEDAADYSWGDLASSTWGDLSSALTFTIPMGIYKITEAMRTADAIKITAYDRMRNFDKNFQKDGLTDARTPYRWLVWMCATCEVPLGMTEAEIKAMPNGSRLLTFSDVNTEIKTYRDLLSQLAMCLAANAMIDREGKLVLKQYTGNVVDTIGADFRYTSDISDYQIYYTGISLNYRAKALQHYETNAQHMLGDTGLTFDMGYNVFLQIAHDSNRRAALLEVINSQLAYEMYTPFQVTMPFNPALEPMDVVQLTGRQAGDSDIAPITSITYRINGRMDIACGGENPALMDAQTKESKAIDGLNDGTSTSGTSYVSSDFWIMLDTFPTEQVYIRDESMTTEVEIQSTVDNTRTQIAWTAGYTLSEAATVTARVTVDDDTIYQVSDLQTEGAHVLNVTTGHEITRQGKYYIRVWLKAEPVNTSSTSDSVLTMGQEMARLTVLGTGWSNTVIEGEDAYTEEGDILDDLLEDLGFEQGDDVDLDLIAEDIGIDMDDFYEDDDGTWLTEDALCDYLDSLSDTADSDAYYMAYNIPEDVIASIKAGPISYEVEPYSWPDSGSPHHYIPSAYFVQLRQKYCTLFNSAMFDHGSATGETYTISTETIAIREGTSKTVYHAGCNTDNGGPLVPSPYSGYPEGFIAWQCLYGSFESQLISKNEDTITSDDIRSGTSGLESKIVDGVTYYKVRGTTVNSSGGSHHSGKF